MYYRVLYYFPIQSVRKRDNTGLPSGESINVQILFPLCSSVNPYHNHTQHRRDIVRKFEHLEPPNQCFDRQDWEYDTPYLQCPQRNFLLDYYISILENLEHTYQNRSSVVFGRKSYRKRLRNSDVDLVHVSYPTYAQQSRTAVW